MANHDRDQRDRILAYLEAHVEELGYPPTYDEIKDAVGLSSKSHVDYYLSDLEDAGLIERTPRTPRGLRLTSQTSSRFEVKLEGFVSAGQPLQVADSLDQEIELTPSIADPRKPLYALRVCGDSMVDALVGDGDIIIAEHCSDVARGQMAVVHLTERNEVTLKQVYVEGARVRLQPAHPSMSPFYVDASQVQIQGQVVAVLRSY